MALEKKLWLAACSLAYAGGTASGWVARRADPQLPQWLQLQGVTIAPSGTKNDSSEPGQFLAEKGKLLGARYTEKVTFVVEKHDLRAEIGILEYGSASAA